MPDTSWFGAGHDVMYGRFVSWGIVASEGFHSGADLSFEARPGVCGTWLSLGREVKNYPRESSGILIVKGSGRMQ